MTQVHTDNHILCLFEDVQFHLEEMGITSHIKEGKLLFVHPEYGAFTVEYKEPYGNAIFLLLDRSDTVPLTYPDCSICEFLDRISRHYLDALSRIPDDEE